MIVLQGIAKFLARARAVVSRLRLDRRGSVAVFLGVALVPLVAAIGIGIDSARGYLVRSRLSQALDSAALAGGRVMFENYRDDDVRMYFTSNFPQGYLGATVSVPSITPDAKNEYLTVTATATLPATFMQIFGKSSITVQASTTINRTNRGMELALVMDNTGSMGGGTGKIQAMKAAATDLINILYGEDDTLPNFWVGLVPYAAVVNVGTSHADWTNTPVYPSIPVKRVGSQTQLFRTTNSGPSSPQTSTVCVTTNVNHGLTDGRIVDIAGAANAAYNGRHLVRVGTANTTTGCTIDATNAATTFWYLIDTTSPTSPDTSATITVTLPQINYGTGAWKGCVEARDPPYEEAQAEAVPAIGGTFKKSFWPSTQGMKFFQTDKNLRKIGSNPIKGDNNWGPGNSPQISQVADNNNSYGPNLGCGPAITPLQPSKATALAAIAGMDAWSRGGTMGNLGLAWGWRVLSPDWRGMWGAPTPANMPLDYNQALIDKVVVMLTDGQNEWYDFPSTSASDHNNGPPGCASGLGSCAPQDADYTAYGRLSENRLGLATVNNANARTEINNRMTSLCAAMKAKKIIVYTIVLQENNAATQALYQSCATKPEYAFISPTSAELSGIFKKIATQLSNLRLSQ